MQIAKKLLNETSLPITEVALVSGFSSIRRFNAVFKETYGRSPSSLRCSGSGRRGDTHVVSLELSYRPPFHWPLLTTLLAHEATPGVEAICHGAYCRTIAVGSAAGYFCVRPVPKRHALLLSLHLPEYAHLKTIVERVRLLFDL